MAPQPPKVSFFSIPLSTSTSPAVLDILSDFSCTTSSGLVTQFPITPRIRSSTTPSTTMLANPSLLPSTTNTLTSQVRRSWRRNGKSVTYNYKRRNSYNYSLTDMDYNLPLLRHPIPFPLPPLPVLHSHHASFSSSRGLFYCDLIISHSIHTLEGLGARGRYCYGNTNRTPSWVVNKAHAASDRLMASDKCMKSTLLATPLSPTTRTTASHPQSHAHSTLDSLPPLATKPFLTFPL